LVTITFTMEVDMHAPSGVNMFVFYAVTAGADVGHFPILCGSERPALRNVSRQYRQRWQPTIGMR
jgi:hypothetical protein